MGIEPTKLIYLAINILNVVSGVKVTEELKLLFLQKAIRGQLR